MQFSTTQGRLVISPTSLPFILGKVEAIGKQKAGAKMRRPFLGDKRT
jgi:hypothetical protein